MWCGLSHLIGTHPDFSEVAFVNSFCPHYRPTFDSLRQWVQNNCIVSDCFLSCYEILTGCWNKRHAILE